MPALSFKGVWLDDLLSGRKKQTTRATDRIKVGHVCSIYNEQRKRITGKPLRKTTFDGRQEISYRINTYGYPASVELEPHNISFELSWYYAHVLGKVKIIDVQSMIPSEMSGENLEAWAWADGFEDSANLGFTPLELADTWFQSRYGDDWMDRTWHVIRWDGWLERYFLADGKPKKAGD